MYFLGYKICLRRYQNLFERLKIPPNPHCQYGSGSRRTGGNLWINADPDPQNLLKICYSATTINNGTAFWTCHPLPTDTPPPSNSTDIQAVQSPCKCDLPTMHGKILSVPSTWIKATVLDGPRLPSLAGTTVKGTVAWDGLFAIPCLSL